MQIIPVFDLQQGILVHAVGGDRQTYRPLRTALLPRPDPEEACATLAGLGFRRVYIADLDAIGGQGHNFDLVRKLTSRYPIQVWLDAGLTGAEEVPLRDVAQVSLVAGSETLTGLDTLSALSRQTGPGRLVFSLDTRDGEVLTPNPALKGIDPADLATEVLAHGVNDMIVLDLRAVGRGAGLNRNLLNKLLRRTSGARLFPGGGLTVADIDDLKHLNIPGVLTATALYEQRIPPVPEL
jgi:phosphoribosylformimino-5-aminoimidazole carboxamide ribotide isomerase